jgi:hypothetical protein
MLANSPQARTTDVEAALALARKAADLEPKRRVSWQVLASVAARAGDQQTVDEANAKAAEAGPN